MAAGILTSPAFPDMASMVAGPALAAGGASWLAWRYLREWRQRHMLPSKLGFRSDPQVIAAGRHEAIREALLFGYTTDKGLPVWGSYQDLMGHLVVKGQSGVGKTVGQSGLMFQHILNGGGVLFIDGKLDYETLETMHQMMVWAGREGDFRVINPGKPEISNTYNPILDGDSDEVAARCLSLIPDTSNSPGADHFRQQANQGISTLIAALQRTGLAYNFIDLTILLQSSAALDYLERILTREAPDAPERINLSIFLNQFRRGKGINIEALKSTFGGIGGRLYMFGTGKFGQVSNHYNPQVRLFDDLLAQRVIYVMLPTMGKAEAASNYGKMVTGDLRTAVSWLQDLPKEQRPWPPTFGLFDEAGSYITKAWDRLFEQSRSSHTILAPAFQTDANLEAISQELREMVEGNTWFKQYYKLGTQATAESAAEMIGMITRVQRSLTMSDSESASSQVLRTTPESNEGAASGVAYQEREQEEYRISPDQLKRLDRGECVLTYGGDRVYNLRVPMIQFSDEFKEKCPPFTPRDITPPFRQGINLFRRVGEFLSAESQQTLENEAKG
ncbi:conjugal transfer protein TraG (plasmid) [Acidihalobacter aeolianus]|uniref:Conjugal transfer protein TraG n=2 Tax=Acidihalobacter aeolianus TaxID=2792603 RepID=A0A1D8KD25_9GAMM|nr:conjugal transfer protein TraG [Acidihalobacter aeolianus]